MSISQLYEVFLLFANGGSGFIFYIHKLFFSVSL